jgi:hypothetical protein
MTHLELENLASEYLEGQLDATHRLEFEAHLAACSACQELVADVRHVMERCRLAEGPEPPPWLISKILLATIGERQPTLIERVAAFVRPALQPRVAYGVAMAVFSCSIIINAAGVNLRHFTLADLNPRTWAYQANRTGHLLYARAEKFYYDLRVVYEIESRLRQLRQQSGQGSQGSSDPPVQESKPETSPGSSTDKRLPDGVQLARLMGVSRTLSDLGGLRSDSVHGKRGTPR